MSKIRKVLASLLAVTILAIALIPSVIAADDDYITLKVVDKNDVAVANARVSVWGDYVKWSTYIDYTDKNGEIRLYDRSAQLNKPVNQKSTYSVTVAVRKVNAKPIIEKFTLKLATAKVGSSTIVKLTSVDTQADVYKAADRTDIYIKNSKGGPVRNMRVGLYDLSIVIPQTNGADPGNSQPPNDPYVTYPYIYGYTDIDGRVTFLDLAVETYDVYFSWKYGGETKEAIKIDSREGVKVFNLTFDETLLEIK